MSAATMRYHNRIAVTFDFDLTLALDNMNALLVRCGVDPKHGGEHIGRWSTPAWMPASPILQRD
jgi:hypothetical protein